MILPRVAMDRASGSVSETCCRRGCDCGSMALNDCICCFSEAILSFSRAGLACATSPSCRSAASRAAM